MPKMVLIWRLADIKHAYQALALDESRKAFAPTLFYIPTQKISQGDLDSKFTIEKDAEEFYNQKLEDAKTLKKDNAPNDEVNKACKEANAAAKEWNRAKRKRVKYQNRWEQHPELKQVWFPGYHINVGGGSSDTLHNESDMEEMSNIAFSWMLDQVKPHLSINEEFIMKDYLDREENFAKLNNAYLNWERQKNARESETWGEWGSRLALSAASSLVHPFIPSTDVPEPVFKKLRVYEWGLGEMKDSYTKMYWANGQAKRTPGKGVEGKKKGKSVTYGNTHEFIHPVVHYRREQYRAMHEDDPKIPLYSPIGKEFDHLYLRRPVIDSHGKPTFEYRIGSSSRFVEEWKMGGADSYERLAIKGAAAYAYIDKVERHNKSGFVGIRCPVVEPKPKEPKQVVPALEIVPECEYRPSVPVKPRHSTFVSKQNEVSVQTEEIEIETRFESSHVYVR
jgi:hypothetical protein